MKIRIRGNSVRLRLLQSEVRQLGESGKVSESIQFGLSNSEKLTYTLQLSAKTNQILAGLCKNEICIALPKDIALNWIETDKVSLKSEKDLGVGKLQILVEKDFVCVTRKNDPDKLDAFPNPDIDC